MAEHTIKYGDTIWHIAQSYGFSDWRIIYDHPQNEDFRTRNPNPDVIAIGEVLHIPSIEERSESAPTGQTTQFVLVQEPFVLRVYLEQDDEGKPFAEHPYELKLGSDEFKNDTTDKGEIKLDLPAGVASRGTITVYDKVAPSVVLCRWDIEFDAFYPASSLEGAEVRLRNLGFNVSLNDSVDDETKAGLNEFRRVFDLRKTAHPWDDAAKQKLLEIYGA